jgi:hypothetical protein
MTELRALLQGAVARAEEEAKATAASSESARLAVVVLKHRPTTRRCWRKIGYSDLVSSLSAESTGVLLLTGICYSYGVARSSANGMPCLSNRR